MTSPFGPLVVIANPRAGGGRAGAGLARAERVLAGAGLAYRTVRTAYPGHAIRVARDALRGGERFLAAAGGDGTVHEVVNGMLGDGVGAAPGAVLGVVAAGSGCDFVKTFGLPGDAAGAARHLAGGAVRPIDVGRVTFGAGAARTSRYFANIAEAGLGGSVVARAARLPGLLGPLRYAAGFWLTLPRFGPVTVRLDADGHVFAWRAHNVVVANGRFYGGGMLISPKSLPDDGLLDLLVMAGPRSAAFTTLPRVYRGTHLPHPGIVELRAGRITVDSDVPLRIEADGETLGTTPATFEVIPRAIRLKV